MALPESELPQWPRPRRNRSMRPRPLQSDFGDETEDDKIQHADLRQHPLGQRPQPQSLFPAALLLLIFAAASLYSWSMNDNTLLAATQKNVFQQGQIWRLLTTLFVHADVSH